MDIIKTTPPELGVPFHIIDNSEVEALAGLSDNPGIDDAIFLDLAKQVLRDTRGLTYKKQIAHLEYLAEKEKTKRSVGHIISMTDLEPAEKPDYFPSYQKDNVDL